MKTQTWKGRRAGSSHERASRLVSSASFAADVARAEANSVGLAKAGAAGEDLRRGQRVLLRVRASIHLALKGKVTTLDAVTLSVHDRGALVVLQRGLPVEARLVLENSATREKIACRVARAPRETPEGYHTSIEFDSPAPEFWKIAFPPPDWRPGMA